jgi:hypothetical protein
MSNFKTIGYSSKDIKDPDLKMLVDDIVDLFKESLYQASYHRTKKAPLVYSKLSVGGIKQQPYKSVGEVLDSYISHKSDAEIKSFVENPSPNRTRSGNLQLLGSLKKVELKNKEYVLNQFPLTQVFGYINDDLIFRRISEAIGLDSDDLVAIPPAPQRALSLKLNLKRVKCVDETNPEWLGKDEISCGGVTVNDREVESIITEFKVGSFNDNTVKNYSPAKVLKSFVLDHSNPSTFLAFISLAEKDNGGFSDFLRDLYEAIRAELTLILTAVGAAAGAAIGSAIGGSIGTAVGGPLGTIIGVVAGLILGALVGWLVASFRDDIFDPQITGVILTDTLPFTGPTTRLNFSDFGGKYYADVFWSAS